MLPVKGIPATPLGGVLTLSNNYLIPKVLIHSDRYKNLQTDAAVLYAVLFDKSIVSDEDDDVLIGDDGRKLFITSPVREIIAGFDFVDKRAEILLRELDSEGLIKVVGQGNGNPQGIIVFPVTEGADSLLSEGIDRPVTEWTDHPVTEEIDCPVTEEIDRPVSEGTDRREVSSAKLRFIGSPVAAGSCEAVTDPAFAKVETDPEYTQAESEPVYTGIKSEPEFVPNEYIPMHELQTQFSDSSGNTASAPHPVSNRIIALRSACNNEFSPSDVRELWISMQDVIEEARWDDLNYLSAWLRSMYSEMHSRVAGGDKLVRIALLQDLISEK